MELIIDLKCVLHKKRSIRITVSSNERMFSINNHRLDFSEKSDMLFFF